MTTIRKVSVEIIDDGKHFEIRRTLYDTEGNEVPLRGLEDMREMDVHDLFMLSVAEAARHSAVELMDLTEKANALANKMLEEGATEAEIRAAVNKMAPSGMIAAAYRQGDDGTTRRIDDDEVPSILH